MSVKIKADWCRWYRTVGATTSGVIGALSPDGTVARVRFDDVAELFVMVAHLEPVLSGR